MGLSRALAALALLSCTACSIETRHRDWSGYEGPGREHFLAEEVPFPSVVDPLERINRPLAGATELVVRTLLAPAGRLYRFVVPSPLRRGLENAGENLRYPKRLVGNLLQAKWGGAWDETRRFGVNTTVGVAGLFDVAAKRGMAESDEDLGQTFTRWGWKRSAYAFAPLYGPTTVRDGIGSLGDAFLDPLNYVTPWNWLEVFNARSDELDPALRFSKAQYDAYQLGRLLHVLRRQAQARDVTFRSADDADDGEVQTLQAVFLVPDDPEFANRGVSRSVRIEATGRELPYTVWPQDGEVPVVYLLPGLGGHRLEDASLALAEIAHDFGATVVVLSSAFNQEFMDTAASVSVPGFAPRDARDVHRALDAVGRDVERRYPGRLGRRYLVGASMGALHTLFIAAAEEDPRTPYAPFDVYVALDPPVDMEHGLRRLDAFYNAPLVWPAGQRQARLDSLIAKVFALTEAASLKPGSELPFTDVEAEYLIGLSFRMTLQFTLLASQARDDSGVLLTRRSALRMAPAFEEASRYSWMEYLYAFVLPWYAEHEADISLDEAGARTILDGSSLPSIAEALRANDKVRVFANKNDFLLRPQDVGWLQELLGERTVFFPEGGHLGNLHRESVQEAIRRQVTGEP